MLSGKLMWEQRRVQDTLRLGSKPPAPVHMTAYEHRPDLALGPTKAATFTAGPRPASTGCCTKHAAAAQLTPLSHQAFSVKSCWLMRLPPPADEAYVRTRSLLLAALH